MFVFEADTAGELWSSAWDEVEARGKHRLHARGDYREALHSVLSLRDPRQRWVTTRKPSINPAFAIAEVIWIVQGRNDSGFLLPWNRALPQYSGEGATLYGAYGERVRSRFGFDQLRRAADALEHSPEQRQVVLQIWDPETDFPTETGHSRAPDIPCNVMAMLKVVDGKLEWLQVMRSNDLIRGLPYNLVQWTSVQEVVAGWMGLDVGNYVHISDSLHVYDRDRSAFTSKLVPDQRSGADLRLSRAESENTFKALETTAEILGQATEEEAILGAIQALDPHSSYADWLYVLAAERTRRLGNPGLSRNLVERIGDAPLRWVTTQWHDEKSPL